MGGVDNNFLLFPITRKTNLILCTLAYPPCSHSYHGFCFNTGGGEPPLITDENVHWTDLKLNLILIIIIAVEYHAIPTH